MSNILCTSLYVFLFFLIYPMVLVNILLKIYLQKKGNQVSLFRAMSGKICILPSYLIDTLDSYLNCRMLSLSTILKAITYLASSIVFRTLMLLFYLDIVHVHIYLPRMFNSMVFILLKKLCNHHHYISSPRTFLLPPKRFWFHVNMLALDHAWPLRTVHL